MKRRKFFKSENEIYKKVLSDYNNDTVELNPLFFDFEVELSCNKLIETYSEIQKEINGDDVIRVENIKVDDNDNVLFGKITELIDSTNTNIFIGNFKKYLQSINGIYRIMELKTDENIITAGRLLNFI